MTLSVAREMLPEAAGERHAALRNYFCDKDATAQETSDGWRLTLAWSEEAERHVDPRLPEGLAWWGEGVRRETMALARRRQGRVLRSLYDTWTLQSWSEWLARRAGQVPAHLTILHVDDHKDLGSPRLLAGTDGWIDAITRAPVDLTKPDLTQSAIESGAIGMGSFLTPFLHLAPHADVRHLCQPPKARETIDYSIELTAQADTLLEPGASRPAIHLEPGAKAAGPGIYRFTASLSDWLADVRPGPILLHIDMDYFNNRYDGDSDWKSHSMVLDPVLDKACDTIDRMIGALRDAGLVERIEDAVIAFSPGFYPAEFWARTDERLELGLASLYA